MQKLTVDLCIFGAGAAGLALAAGSVRLGSKTIIVEPGAFGGRYNDALAMQVLRAAAMKASHAQQDRHVSAGAGVLNDRWREVKKELRAIAQRFSPMVKAQRFHAMGITIIPARGRFINERLAQAGDYEICARKFVVATGSRPTIPKIAGLEFARYQTCDTIFDVDELPDAITIIGDSAAGVELAQCFSRLGARVTLIGPNGILTQEDSDVVDSLTSFLRADGVNVRLNTGVDHINLDADGQNLKIVMNDGEEIATSLLVLATGRQPNIENLGLQHAGAAFQNGALKLDASLRATNRKIYALGGAAGVNSIHSSRRQAFSALRNIFFALPTQENFSPVTRFVATDPELAAVGLSEAAARAAGIKFKIFRAPLYDVDSTVINGESGGAIKILASPRGKILGCSILAPRAGELIVPLILAMHKNLSVADIAEIFPPYPAYAQAVQQAAAEFYADKTDNPWIKLGLWIGKRF